jgi:Domain of unknown function (DUF5658)
MEVRKRVPPATTGQNAPERRRGERRHHVLRALLQGSFTPRRRAPRRADESTATAVDWHHPQWLAIATLIVLFSCADALLTLMLLERGAYEINPLMAPLVGGSARAFALVKVGLTAGGVVLLTQIARIRAFGLYGVVMVYELSLLDAA